MTDRRSPPSNVREHDKFMLRLPDGMRDELKAESDRNSRSMNAEIVARLERSLAADKEGLDSPVVQDLMIQRMQHIMDEVVDDMRAERRIYNAIPLVLKWFQSNPEERAEFDALSNEEQDEFIREKAHDLWIDQINAKRAARGKKRQ